MSAASIKRFAASLRELPRVVAIKVATAAAPALSEAARTTFGSGEDAYGAPWIPKVDGSAATLVDTGALAQGIQYVATGTKLRVRLGVDYAKYQLGKRPAFPRASAALPASYLEALTETTQSVIEAEVSS